MAKRHHHLPSLDLPTALRGIRAYNSGVSKTTRKQVRRNIELDTAAREIFRCGIAEMPSGVHEQVLFIGDEYGGVAGRPGALRLAGAIAEAIIARAESLSVRAAQLPRLIDAAPAPEDLEILFAPFVQALGPQRHWHVWAWKFWHFVNPLAIAIPDSRVDGFFGVDAMPAGTSKYRMLLDEYRAYIVARRDWVPAMEDADGLGSTELKLWDKVFYVLPELEPPS